MTTQTQYLTKTHSISCNCTVDFNINVRCCCSFRQGSSQLWTHTSRIFCDRPIALTQERSLVDDVYECVHEWNRARKGWVGVCSLSDTYNTPLLGVAYCQAQARLTDACYSTSVSGPSQICQLRPTSARLAPWRCQSRCQQRSHVIEDTVEPSVACPGLSPWSSCA